MPITIYRKMSPPEELAYFGEDCWNLPTLVPALEDWLEENKIKVEPGEYVADIGFTPRSDASGGGSAISPDSMKTMANLGIWLFLSEYPAD